MAGRHRWGKALAAVAALTMAVMTGVAAGPVAAVASDGTTGVSDSPLNCQAPEDQQGQGIPICDDKGTFLFTHADQDNDPLLHTYIAPDTGERINIYYHFEDGKREDGSEDAEKKNGVINMGEPLYVYLRVRNVSNKVLNTKVTLDVKLNEGTDPQRDGGMLRAEHKFQNFPVYKAKDDVKDLHEGEMYMGLRVDGLEPEDATNCQLDVDFHYYSQNGEGIGIQGSQTQALTIDDAHAPAYTIIFHTNSDAPESITPPSQTMIPEGQTGYDPATMNENPIRYGWVFDGWFKDDGAFKNKYDFNIPVSDSVPPNTYVLHLYARWTNARFVGNSLHRWKYVTVAKADQDLATPGQTYFGKTDLRYEFEFSIPSDIDMKQVEVRLRFGKDPNNLYNVVENPKYVCNEAGTSCRINLVIKGYPNGTDGNGHHYFDAKLAARLSILRFDDTLFTADSDSDSNMAGNQLSSVRSTMDLIKDGGDEDDNGYVTGLEGWTESAQFGMKVRDVPNANWDDEKDLANTIG